MAAPSICIIPGCGKKAHKSKHCSMHAARIRIHGSPYKGTFKPRGKCSVASCEKPHYGRGYCSAHYKRFRKYGDPRAGAAPTGAPMKFLNDALASDTDACIPFPYGKVQGYGRLRHKGETIGTHVYVAEKAHGPKPSPKHEVCHSCGKGHEGCVNPKHLYWGTRRDNVRDAIRHGTYKAPPNPWETGARLRKEQHANESR